VIIMVERFPNDKKDEPQSQYAVDAEADDGSGSSEILGALIAEGMNSLSLMKRARAQLRLEVNNRPLQITSMKSSFEQCPGRRPPGCWLEIKSASLSWRRHGH